MATAAMSVVYVLTTPIVEDGGDDPTVEQIRKRNKWDNEDYVYRGLIVKEAKYMTENASSKKFLVSNFTYYKMTDSRSVIEQYNELLGVLAVVAVLYNDLSMTKGGWHGDLCLICGARGSGGELMRMWSFDDGG
ncbi:hypothetical protein Tco_0286335 [Tanacetum coccineum]